MRDMEGRWWEAMDTPPDNNDTCDDNITKDLEFGSERMTDSSDVLLRSDTIINFMHDCRAILNTDEFIFLCLWLAGFKYYEVEAIVTSLPKSDSSAHRKVISAKSKLRQLFRHIKDLNGDGC